MSNGQFDIKQAIMIPKAIMEKAKEVGDSIGAKEPATTLILALAVLDLVAKEHPDIFAKVNKYVETLDAIHEMQRKRNQPPPSQ